MITDWRLPDGEHGIAFKSSIPPLATPIILMTIFGNERIALEALKSGALDYVVKSPEVLLDTPHLTARAIEE